MNYEEASVDEIATHFDSLTRQRISQILLSYTSAENTEVVDKIKQAKTILKDRKYLRKNGCSLIDTRRCRGIWEAMVERVRKDSAYLDCRIDFPSERVFREWAIRQVGFREKGFELDKDILVKGNRVYSAATCVFVPREINSLFSNCYLRKNRGPYPIGVSFNKGSGTFVAQMSNRQQDGLDKYLGSFATVEEAFACYKVAKEAKIKRLAEKWRDRIDPTAYEALMARTVERED